MTLTNPKSCQTLNAGLGHQRRMTVLGNQDQCVRQDRGRFWKYIKGLFYTELGWASTHTRLLAIFSCWQVTVCNSGKLWALWVPFTEYKILSQRIPFAAKQTQKSRKKWRPVHCQGMHENFSGDPTLSKIFKLMIVPIIIFMKNIGISCKFGHQMAQLA